MVLPLFWHQVFDSQRHNLRTFLFAENSFSYLHRLESGSSKISQRAPQSGQPGTTRPPLYQNQLPFVAWRLESPSESPTAWRRCWMSTPFRVYSTPSTIFCLYLSRSLRPSNSVPGVFATGSPSSSNKMLSSPSCSGKLRITRWSS